MNPVDAVRRRTLGVVLTSDRGLRHWRQVGSLSRELELYRQLHGRGWDISLFSYDRRPAKAPAGFPITTVPQWPFVLPRVFGGLYRALLPVVRLPRKGARLDVVLTNQAHSGWPALALGRLAGAKVIARCGWVVGEHAEVMGLSGLRVRGKQLEERLLFSRADRCVVPTAALASWISRHYVIAAEKIVVIPNYVDVERFRPLSRTPVVDVISVGRLTAVKRHELLIEALAGTGRKVRIVGDGPRKRALMALAAARGVDLEILARVPNEALPGVLAEARVYAALSSWEGHPKALLEAMACGLPCVGTSAPGVVSALEDGRTGALVDATPAAVRARLLSLLHDEQERHKLGAAARDEVVSHCALEVVLARYAALLDELIAE